MPSWRRNRVVRALAGHRSPHRTAHRGSPMPLPTNLLDELKALYPRATGFHHLEHEGDEAVVQAPSRAEWRRFQDATADRDKRPRALENLYRACAVWAQGAASAQRKDVEQAMDAQLERRPGLAETFGNSCTRLAGLAGEADAKKL